MAYESNSIFWIEVEKVVPNPFQPRREFDPEKLKELADSIRMYGILQPLVVTRREIMRENGAFSTEYELIAGERRLRASKLAGLTQVPVIIRTGEESQLMKLELAIIENLQREDLNAVDRALAFKQLSEQFGLSHAQVAVKVGRSREYVSNSIRLLNLPDTILGALRVNDISDGHARTLLMLNDRPEEQDIVFREILLKKLSVREVERIARKIATEKVRKKEWANSDPELIEIERQFTETLGTRVQILKTDFGGKLTIDYFSPEDLQKLLMLVHGTPQPLRETYNDAPTVLEHIVVATPLEAVSDTNTSLPTLETPPDEEVFTRFDSLHVPEATAAELEEEDAVSEFDFPLYTHEPIQEPAPQEVSVVSLEQSVPAVSPYHVSEQHIEVPTAPIIREEVVPQPAYVPPVVVQVPTQVVDASREVTPVIAPYTPVVPVSPMTSTPAPQKTADVDESDLYSIKNFSL